MPKPITKLLTFGLLAMIMAIGVMVGVHLLDDALTVSVVTATVIGSIGIVGSTACAYGRALGAAVSGMAAGCAGAIVGILASGAAFSAAAIGAIVASLVVAVVATLLANEIVDNYYAKKGE